MTFFSHEYLNIFFLIFSFKDIKLLPGKPYMVESNSSIDFKAALALLLDGDSRLLSEQDALLILAIVYLVGHIDPLFFDIQHN